MKRMVPLLLLLGIILSMGSAKVAFARDVGPVVLVDFSHGESPAGDDVLLKILPYGVPVHITGSRRGS